MKCSVWIAAAALVSTAINLCGQGERQWRSKDGRAIAATGVGATLDGVLVARSDGSHLTIPFTSLDPDDSKWALQNLKFSVNDQVEAAAVTKSQAVNRFERGTGNYAICLEIYRIRSGVYEASGSATEIMEKVKESGRSVSIKLSPTLGVKQGGAVAVELYTIAGQGSNKEVAAMSAGIFNFSPDGSIVVMETDVVENFSGWAVLVRSLNSGRIIASPASMHHFIDFANNKAPAEIDFTDAIKRLKDKIIADL